jgi:hypothetical protein
MQWDGMVTTPRRAPLGHRYICNRCVDALSQVPEVTLHKAAGDVEARLLSIGSAPIKRPRKASEVFPVVLGSAVEIDQTVVGRSRVA